MGYEQTFFNALSEPIRLRALLLLGDVGELCVCDLMLALRIDQPKMSKHLAILREAGVVVVRRDGQRMLYSIAPDVPRWARVTLDAVSAELFDNATYAADVKRLQKAVGRSGQRVSA